ncbi:MAG: DoxX family protein [Ignavibacteriaceae bacterium]|nr:DoxX family protein [Ignavibacteriaceae bacterium]
MNQYKKITDWLSAHSDLAYPFIRIFLGVALLIRGVMLLINPEALTQLEGASQFYWSFSYVIILHIIGGIMLAIGLATRIAALLQIPVLFGAVFFIHLKQGLVVVEQSFELSVLVLVLLTVFFLFGGGGMSFDEVLARKKAGK